MKEINKKIKDYKIIMILSIYYFIIIIISLYHHPNQPNNPLSIQSKIFGQKKIKKIFKKKSINLKEKLKN